MGGIVGSSSEGGSVSIAPKYSSARQIRSQAHQKFADGRNVSVLVIVSADRKVQKTSIEEALTDLWLRDVAALDVQRADPTLVRVKLGE